LSFYGDQSSFVGTWSATHSVLGHLGPEISLLSFRFGEKREMELEIWQGLLLPLGTTYASFHQGVTFRCLFL